MKRQPVRHPLSGVATAARAARASSSSTLAAAVANPEGPESGAFSTVGMRVRPRKIRGVGWWGPVNLSQMDRTPDGIPPLSPMSALAPFMAVMRTG
eukprot:COSAG01_NODE_5543_length_4195_cov_1.542725_5_plen_96_part_00